MKEKEKRLSDCKRELDRAIKECQRFNSEKSELLVERGMLDVTYNVVFMFKAIKIWNRITDNWRCLNGTNSLKCVLVLSQLHDMVWGISQVIKPQHLSPGFFLTCLFWTVITTWSLFVLKCTIFYRNIQNWSLLMPWNYVSLAVYSTFVFTVWACTLSKWWKCLLASCDYVSVTKKPVKAESLALPPSHVRAGDYSEGFRTVLFCISYILF